MRVSKLLVLSASALALTTGAAHAQSPSRTATDVEEVVVTASPLGVAEKALTANVDAINEEQLASAPAVGLGDLVSGLPGVRSTSFAPGASRPVIRGLSGPRVQVLTNGLGMIDASSVSEDHAVASDPGEAKQVEVVRGPGTLAYGGSAIGGVVNIIDSLIADETPVDGVEGRFSAQYSSVDEGRSASGAVHMGRGPWVLGVQGVRRQTEDYDIPGPAISQRLADALGAPRTGPGTVVNSASDLTAWGVGLSYIGDAGFLGGSVKRTDSIYGTVAEPDVTIDLEQTRADARGAFDGDLGPFATVRGSAGYADYTHTEFEGPDPGTVFFSEGLEGRLELVQKERGAWKGAVGFQALKRDFEAVGDEALIPSVKIGETGIYTVQRVDRGPVGFEAGLRFDRRTLDSVIAERAFDNWSASVGVFFRPTTGLYLGVSAGRTERAPNEIELFADGPHPATGQFEIGDSSFKSEVATSVEAAAHYEADRLTFDLHLFNASYDGFIDLRPTGVTNVDSGLPVFRFVQTDATFRGAEIEGSYRLWEDGDRRVSVEAAADTVRARTDLGDPARIPPWSITGRLVYEAPRWDGKLEVRRVGEQDETAAFELPTDGFTLVNLYGSWRPHPESGLRLFAEARNLGDAEEREHASPLKDVAPLQGRNIRVGLAYRF